MNIVDLIFSADIGDLARAKTGLEGVEGASTRAEVAAFKFGKMIGDAGKAAVIAAGTAAAALGGLTLKIAGQIDDLNDLAQMYGYSVTQISAMKFAAEDAGGSLEDVTRAASKAKKELADGGAAFATLGVSVRNSNGELKTGIELATEVAQKYNEGSTSAEQFSAVQEVLGRDVDKATAVLLSQAAAIEMVNDLNSKGIGIYQESVDATDAYSAAKARANIIMDSMGSVIVAKLLPAFTYLIKSFTDSYESGGLVRQIFDGIVAAVPAMVSGISAIMQVFVGLGTVVRIAVDGVTQYWTAIRQWAGGDFSGAIKTVKNIGSSALTSAEQGGAAINALREKTIGLQAILAKTDTNKLTLASAGVGRTSTGAAGVRAGTKVPTPKIGSSASSIDPLSSLLAGTDTAKTEKYLTTLAILDTRYFDNKISATQYAEALAILTGKMKAKDDGTLKLIETEKKYIEGLYAQVSPTTALINEQLKLEELMVKYPEQIDVLWAAWNKLQDKMEDVKEKTTEMSVETQVINKVFDDVGSAMTNAFQQGEFNFKSFLSTFLKGIANMIFQLTVVQPMMERMKNAFSSGGGGWGGIINSIAGAFGGGKAAGGHVTGGKQYLVGERGPEMFVPRGSGTIVPNNKMGNGMSIGSIVINVEGGNTNADTAAALKSELLSTMKQVADGRIANARRSGGLLNA